MKSSSQWLLCPICNSKTRIKLREDTVLKNFLLFCPKCKQESLLHVIEGTIINVKEPDAIDAEPNMIEG